MSDRAYTVAEIDALRRACADRWLYGTSVPPTGVSRGFRQSEMDAAVEQLVRTFMLAGITGADMVAADRGRNIPSEAP